MAQNFFISSLLNLSFYSLLFAGKSIAVREFWTIRIEIWIEPFFKTSIRIVQNSRTATALFAGEWRRNATLYPPAMVAMVRF